VGLTSRSTSRGPETPVAVLPYPPSGRFSFKERVGELEKELILNALEETHWVQTKAKGRASI